MTVASCVAMQTVTHNDQAPLTQTRQQDVVTQATKSVEHVREGITQFVGQNGRSLGAAAAAMFVLLAAGRMISLRRAETRFLPRMTRALATGRKPLRRAARSVRTRASEASVSAGALTGAAALIGTSLTVWLVPRLFARFMR